MMSSNVGRTRKMGAYALRVTRLVLALSILLSVCTGGVPATRAAGGDGPRPIPYDPTIGPLESLPFTASPQTQAPVQAPGLSSAVTSWSKIVFQSLRDNNWEIYSANGDGKRS